MSIIFGAPADVRKRVVKPLPKISWKGQKITRIICIDYQQRWIQIISIKFIFLFCFSRSSLRNKFMGFLVEAFSFLMQPVFLDKLKIKPYVHLWNCHNYLISPVIFTSRLIILKKILLCCWYSEWQTAAHRKILSEFMEGKSYR